MISKTSKQLFEKYDVQAPRYTSYPTVPYWNQNPTTDEWIGQLQSAFAIDKMSWSIYVHVPFCETLCTFCGCNTSITKDHDRESPYVKTVLNEWQNYLKRIPQIKDRPLKQLHLGGGSPTFLSSMNLQALVKGLLDGVEVDRDHFEGSIEVDPRRTSKEQLAVLRELGFNRVSMGVQDFNPEVQRLINRIQPREMTEKLTQDSRDLGYESVNFDLIYGLPKQTLASIREMAEVTVQMRPDRIALYSFALVPWIKPAQRLFRDDELPVGAEKRELYEASREILLEAGYVEIGMDHFALPSEALAKADVEKKLHRNFMGYTDQKTDVLLGLGVSSISEAPGCFHQNEKALPVYERRVSSGEIATFRGHLLSVEDRERRQQILEFMTQWKVKLESEEQVLDVTRFLRPMLEDGLVKIEGRTLQLTESGKPFLRNACMALDSRLRSNAPERTVFSRSM